MARPYCRLILLLWIVLSTAVYAEETVEMNEYLLNRSFMSAVKKQNYDKALATMTELLELSPGNQKYHYDLGQVYMALEDYEKAAESFQNAQGSSYRNLEEDAKFALGTTKLAQSQIDPAIDLFKEIVKINPGNIAARKNLEMALALKQMQPQQEQQNQDQQEQENNEQQEKQDAKEEADQDEENQEENQDSSNNSNEQGNQDEEDESMGEISESDEKLDKQKASELLQLLAPDEDDVREKYLKKNAQKVTRDNDW